MQTKSIKKSGQKSIGKGKWMALIVTLTVVLVTISFLAYEGTKKTVALTLDGDKKIIKTHADTIGDILKDLDIETRKEDKLSPAAATKVTNDLAVVWVPAKKVEVAVGDTPKTVWTTAKNVEELLANEKITVGEHDIITPGLDEEISENMTIAIEEAFKLTLVDGKEEGKELWSTTATVSELLEKQEIELQELDRVSPELGEPLKADDTIAIVRVEKATDVVEEPTEFTVVTKKDESLLEGTEKVVQEGKAGANQKTFEVVRENGEEVSRELVSEEQVKESTEKIVSVGTKVVVAQVSRGQSASEAPAKQASAPAQVDSTPVPVAAAQPTPVQQAEQPVAQQAPAAPEPVAAVPSGGREFMVESTAYSASCNGCTGITAYGINLLENPGMKVIAVDPSVIPLGSTVLVEGYGQAIAGDTGGAIKGNKIDVFFADKATVYQWGRKQVKVTILN